MKNQYKQGTPQSPRMVLLPSTVKAGDPLLVGSEPCVALDDYQANEGGATCYFNGSFNLTVVGSTSHSPYTPAVIKPGDKIYATGVLDTPTNVTIITLLSATTTDTLFGVLDPEATAVGSGVAAPFTPVRLING
jgi:hypothetical protein